MEAIEMNMKNRKFSMLFAAGDFPRKSDFWGTSRTSVSEKNSIAITYFFRRALLRRMATPKAAPQ